MIVAGGTLCRAWSLGKRSREKFRLKIRVCVIVLLLVAPSAVLPQNGGESLAKPRMDSLGKKNYFLPLAEGAAANGMVWAFDRWALNADYADISVHTMKQNLQTSPTMKKRLLSFASKWKDCLLTNGISVYPSTSCPPRFCTLKEFSCPLKSV